MLSVLLLLSFLSGRFRPVGMFPFLLPDVPLLTLVVEVSRASISAAKSSDTPFAATCWASYVLLEVDGALL